MADLRIDVAAEFKGKKAFKEADRATGSLDKAVGKLGKQLATVFATTKVIAFGKASVKAFLDDQKAATRLASAVKNLGLSYEQPGIDRFIAKLESTTGIVDDQLRPAFQALLTTTGSVTRSQEILSQAIDISRGSGIELTTVTQDLANAYVGNTKGLKKYNTGLTAAQLKAASFEEIQRKLNAQFSGASAAYLATYAGKMEFLTTAADNAKETIGKGLVDALSILGSQGTTDIEKATTAMDELATSTANVIRGNAVVLSNLASLGGGKAGKIGGYIKGYFKEVLGIQALEDLGKATLPRPKRGFVSKGNANNVTFLTKAEKDAAKNAKAIADSTKKNTAELKKQTALKKAGTVFDLEQIQIIAALKGKLSEEDKIRLQAQLAILNENEALATSLTRQILMAQDSTGGLYKFFLAIGDMKIANPFAFLDQWILEFQKKLNALTFPKFDPNAPSGSSKKPPVIDPATNPFGFPIGDKGGIGTTSIQATVSSNLAIQDTFNAVMLDALAAGNNYTQSAIQALSSARYEALAQSYGMGGSTGGTMQLELKVTGDGDLTNAIASSLQQQSLSTGNSTYINRRTGGFE
jgi:hypothetical protein